MTDRRVRYATFVVVLACLSVTGWGLYEAGQLRGLREAQVSAPPSAPLLLSRARARAAPASPTGEAPRGSAPPVIVTLPQGTAAAPGSVTAQGGGDARPTAGASVAAVLNAIAWPLVVLAAVLVLRQRLPSLLESLAGRVTKVGFAGVSIELPVATPVAPSWAGDDPGVDIRTAAAMRVTTSYVGTFFHELEHGGAADYAEIDLGQGKAWLTSRLYIMSIVFAQVRGIQAIVFVETDGVKKRYLTWAEPQRVRWALARAYPWLEKAYAYAYCAAVSPKTVKISPTSRRLELVHEFLKCIQDPLPPEEQVSQADPDVQAESGTVRRPREERPPDSPAWESLPGSDPETYEHASWLTGAEVEALLGRDRRSALRSTELVWRSREEQVRVVRSMPDAFVPVTDGDGRFERLIDRRALVEQVARSG